MYKKFSGGEKLTNFTTKIIITFSLDKTLYSVESNELQQWGPPLELVNYFPMLGSRVPFHLELNNWITSYVLYFYSTIQ